MKRIVPILLLAACGGRPSAPVSISNVPMPAGAALKPFDPAQPGLARPSAMTVYNGRAYIALGNYDGTYTVRGPGMLAVLDPATGSLSTIDLGGAGGKQCLQPSWVRESGGKLYVTCSGNYSPGSGEALLEVDPATARVTRALQPPVVPSGIAFTASRIWFGDAFSGAVYAVDRGDFSLAAGPLRIPCPETGYQTTNDVILVQGDLYAACSNGDAGILSRLDPGTGAVKMQVDSGPIAVEYTETGDGRIAIVSGGDNRLRLVTIGASALTVKEAYTFGDKTSAIQDVHARDQFLFTAASGSNTVQKLDLTKSGPQMLVGEANVGDGASPWNIVPLDDDHALVTNQLGNSVVSVSSDCSGGKVCWARP